MSRTPKRLIPTGVCFCGCGSEVALGKFFVPSHDRKAEAAVIRLKYGSVAAFVVAHGYGPGGANAQKERERAERDRPQVDTTAPGYRNANQQVTVRKTSIDGTDHRQKVYVLRCERPAHPVAAARDYGANGSDIHIRKCPVCQNGAPGLAYE